MTSRGAIRKALTLTGIVMLVGCGDSSPRLAGKASSSAKSSAPSAAPVQAAAEDQEKKMELKEEDFVERDTNRDPFRPYLAEFLTPQRRTAKIQRKVLLQRYGLDELELIAVVAGRIRPVAMFRDPTGLGVTVKRGDYISKSAGKIKQILPDKVVVQIEERLEGGQSMADRVISMHPQNEGLRSKRR